MKKLYLDYPIYDRYREQTDADEAVTLDLEGGTYRLVRAGTEILALRGDPKDPYYREIAGKSGLNFSLMEMFRRSPSMQCPISASSEGTKRGAFLP